MHLPFEKMVGQLVEVASLSNPTMMAHVTGPISV